MNLTDYPTPRSDQMRNFWLGDRPHEYQAPFEAEAFHEVCQLEREAAAWKSVAEKLATEMRDLAWLSGPAGSTQPNDAELALAAFDALKSQLTQP